jgi:excisionase family DNA binding protein
LREKAGLKSNFITNTYAYDGELSTPFGETAVQKKSLINPGVTDRKPAVNGNRNALGLSVIGFATAMGVSRTFVYTLIASGAIKTIKLGDRRIIPASEVDRLLETAA